MRCAVWTVFVLAFTATTSFAQTAERWAEKMFRQNGGTTTHDFGSVARGAQLHHRFAMTNIYAVPLDIIGTRASCGCVRIAPSATSLKPRETGYIDVMMDASRFTGPKKVTIFVTVGPQFTSTAYLEVSANSRADIVFNPGQVNFGVVARGLTPKQTIDVEYAGGLDWHITGMVKTNAPLEVAMEQLYRRPGQVGYRLHFTLKKEAPAGAFKQEILLQTNDPASPLVPLLVEATIQAALSVVPSTVSLGEVKVGEAVVKSVLVRGSKPFRVVSVEGAGDGIDVELPMGVAPVQRVTIKFQPSRGGELKRELLFKTDLEGETPAIVTVEGKALP